MNLTRPTRVHDPEAWLKETNQKFDIFYYPYYFTLKDKIYTSIIQNKSIVDECIRHASVPANNSLAGDIQNEFRVTNTDVISQVEHELKWHVSNIFNNSVSISKIDLDSMWVNYQKATEYNPIHFHTSGEFSFVIYADIPETVRQEHKQSFGNYKSRGLVQFTSQFTNQNMLFNPSRYTILIFESSHLHQVYPFYSNETRITISGNILGTFLNSNLGAAGELTELELEK
jgi:hypothetical protein